MFFRKKTECTHLKVNPDVEGQYCPDCGKYIENKWYMVRCTCCNVKRKTIIKQGLLQPLTKYCPNCGAQAFYSQEVKNINFIDINFAALKKEIGTNKTGDRNQLWVEREPEPVRLLGLKLN